MHSITKIDVAEEFIYDWEWYARDLDGNVACFTTAGLRGLPYSVKQDRDALERVGRYFSEVSNGFSEYSIRDGVEADHGGWNNAAARTVYLRFFIQTATRGIFAYDTEIRRGAGAKYYLVAKPNKPLRLSTLPLEIAEIVSKTQAPISFANREYIPETETLDW